MADTVIFMDGWDHYNVNTQYTQKWSGNFGGAPSTQTPGRFSYGQALRASTAHGLQKDFTTNYGAWRIGFAMYVEATGSNPVECAYYNEGGTNHVSVGMDSSRLLRITRNFTGSLVANTSYTVPLSTWIHVEWYCVITDSTSAGYCIVKVNGTTVLNLSAGGDTRNGGSGVLNRLYMGGQSFWNIYYDDMVLTAMDTTTTPAFLGDKRIYTLYPDGNGNYSQFTGSDGNSTNNYQQVDETTIDTSDYNEDGTAGDRDSYTMTAPSISPDTISVVQLSVSAAKTDSGSRTFKPFVRIGSTNYDQATETPNTSATVHRAIMETSPATSSAWTSSELSSVEAGVKIEA